MKYDVIVIGAGNAALCAAIAAKEKGSSVLVVEKAPRHQRGGNSYFTAGGFRFAYSGIEDLRPLIADFTAQEEQDVEFGTYTKSKYHEDLGRLTEDLTDPVLSSILINESLATVTWLKEQGIRWVPMYGRQSFKVNNKFHFWGGLILEASGGGKGLVEKEFEIFESLGGEVVYESAATKLLLDENGHIEAVSLQGPDGGRIEHCKSVVLACGGFESNAEMRTRYLGPGWELAKVRGTQYNTGDGIQMALQIGAESYGNWSGCHAVAWDVAAPPFGDRKILDLYQKHSYPLGLIVNKNGERFVDEGLDYRNFTYVKFGREIMNQPGRIAFQIFDSKVEAILRDEYRIKEVTMVRSPSIEHLAEEMGINTKALVGTVDKYNQAVKEGSFNPAVLDGKKTMGLPIDKSNWAQRIDSPPFIAYAVTCGITFTFGGLHINKSAEVLSTSHRVIPGLYAAGELVGGLFYHNYPGGAGLMAGAVFGRIAGTSAHLSAQEKHS